MACCSFYKADSVSALKTCSQCSLEGEALQENERRRAEIREKREKIISLMERVRKLNLQPQIAHNLLWTALPVAWTA